MAVRDDDVPPCHSLNRIHFFDSTTSLSFLPPLSYFWLFHIHNRIMPSTYFRIPTVFVAAYDSEMIPRWINTTFFFFFVFFLLLRSLLKQNKHSDSWYISQPGDGLRDNVLWGWACLSGTCIDLKFYYIFSLFFFFLVSQFLLPSLPFQWRERARARYRSGFWSLPLDLSLLFYLTWKNKRNSIWISKPRWG